MASRNSSIISSSGPFRYSLRKLKAVSPHLIFWESWRIRRICIICSLYKLYPHPNRHINKSSPVKGFAEIKPQKLPIANSDMHAIWNITVTEYLFIIQYCSIYSTSGKGHIWLSPTFGLPCSYFPRSGTWPFL